jgi:hypothetical protein
MSPITAQNIHSEQKPALPLLMPCVMAALFGLIIVSAAKRHASRRGTTMTILFL